MHSVKEASRESYDGCALKRKTCEIKWTLEFCSYSKELVFLAEVAVLFCFIYDVSYPFVKFD